MGTVAFTSPNFILRNFSQLSEKKFTKRSCFRKNNWEYWKCWKLWRIECQSLSFDWLIDTAVPIWICTIKAIAMRACWKYILVRPDTSMVLGSRHSEGSTNEAYSSCFYFRISWILMKRPWKHFLVPAAFWGASEARTQSRP